LRAALADDLQALDVSFSIPTLLPRNDCAVIERQKHMMFW